MARSRPRHPTEPPRRRAGTHKVPARSHEPLLPKSSSTGVRYAPLSPDDASGRALFEFAGATLPSAITDGLGWGAWVDDRLVGVLILERAGSTGMVYGPLVVDVSDPLEVGASLVGTLLASALAIDLTLFTRPQGLDRVWVRYGFIPGAEAMLPESLKGRPGIGLYLFREGQPRPTRESVARA